jgi:CheY-like chemotaxis protein
MAPFSQKTAVIVEDDETSIKVLEQLLSQLGVQTVIIRDSIESSRLLQSIDRPDVIFLDLEMPRSSGYAVLAMIHEMASLRGVPTVAYTTHTSHLNEAKRAGFHSFIGKPLDSHLFKDQLSRILSGTPVWEVAS